MTSWNGNIFRVTTHLCGEMLSKQSWCLWFETLSRPLWRHCNVEDDASLTVLRASSNLNYLDYLSISLLEHELQFHNKFRNLRKYICLANVVDTWPFIWLKTPKYFISDFIKLSICTAYFRFCIQYGVRCTWQNMTFAFRYHLFQYFVTPFGHLCFLYGR